MRVKSIAAVSIIALSVSACSAAMQAQPQPQDTGSNAGSGDQAPLRADVNPGYKVGSVKIPTKPTASLQEVLSRLPSPGRQEKPKDAEDKLRLPAMQDAAHAYGARAGLAWATREINRALEARSAELTRTYDFQRLMIQGPNGVMVLPPVISEARDAWESFDAGKTLRVADTVYEIISQSRFTSVAPMWQSYLISDFKEPEPPPAALAPKDDNERELYRQWVMEGWKKGEQQAQEIFQANMDRLVRDFTGMVRYRQLLEEGKVEAPILAEGNLGVTGTGQDMRVNDRAIRITRDPLLKVNPNAWGASVTGTGPDGKPVGPERRVSEPGDEPTAPKAKPKPKRGSAWGSKASSREEATSARKGEPAPRKTARPTDDRTTGGAGRF